MKLTLEKVASRVLTLEEAHLWLASCHQDFGLTKAPTAWALKFAAREGRLVAVKKGGLNGVWLTNREELEKYLRNYRAGNQERKRKAKAG